MKAIDEHSEDLTELPSVSECRNLVERVAISSQFARSARLRDFLLYITHEALEADSPEISEQEIGVRVFGRMPSYDRGQDNIVRVNASELRKRVDKYFETEGLSERIVFSIPRGGYEPIFRWREVQAERNDPVPPQTFVTRNLDNPLTRPANKHLQAWLWASLTTFLLAACCLLAWQNRNLRKSADISSQKPSVGDFWANFVQAAPETDIVLPDASVTMRDEMLGTQISLNDYIHHSYFEEAVSVSGDRRADLHTIFGHNLITVGDFLAAQHLLSLGPIAPSLHLSLARFYEADTIKRANLILIGGRKANPWVGLFDEQLNFSLEYGGEKHIWAYVKNKSPEPGESATYYPSSDQKHVAAYSVVACIPNLSKTGKVILLGGTDSEATESAAEFLTSEEGLSTLMSRLHTSHLGYFEALIRTSRLNGVSFSAELLAARNH